MDRGYWEKVEEMPEGFEIDKFNGSPLAGYVFIIKGKSPLTGQIRKLLKIKNNEDLINKIKRSKR